MAAVIPIKHLGTNGGGFSARTRPIRSRTRRPWTNYSHCVNILLFPFALVIMFGRMLEATCATPSIIYGVMMVMFVAMIGWASIGTRCSPTRR